jgi:hypothetical protein
MKLIKNERSPNPKKKWRATFLLDNGKEKHTDYGDATMEDYTQHHDKERREAYRARHKKDLRTNDPTRAGYLSYYVLWGDYKSVESNLNDYKRRFNL